MSCYEYEKYVTSKEKMRETLKEYGVAIIPNVLDEKECDNMLSGIWNYFEHISQKWETPINKKDEKDTFYTQYFTPNYYKSRRNRYKD